MDHTLAALVLVSLAAMVVGYLRARAEQTVYLSDLDMTDIVVNGLLIGLLACGLFWLVTRGIH